MNCKKLYLEWLGYNEYEIEEVETEIKNGEKPLDFESYKYYTWESGYNKALEEVKHDLMMKLKDEGIVKPLKDSISRNERLSSKEQQELCEWIECAMGFGENLDECEEKLTEAKELLKRWIGDKVYTVSEQKDLIADTEQFLEEQNE